MLLKKYDFHCYHLACGLHRVLLFFYNLALIGKRLLIADVEHFLQPMLQGSWFIQ
jgi:hypothetical protein